MNTTSRFVPVPFDVSEREEALVALIGFKRAGSSAAGLFARCQLRILDLPTLDTATRSFEMIAPDAVIVDSHHTALKRLSQATHGLLRALRSQQHGRQIPLLLLGSTGVAPELRSAFLEAGAILVPVQFQTHRQLIRRVRRLCGFAASCCAVGDLPKHS